MYGIILTMAKKKIVKPKCEEPKWNFHLVMGTEVFTGEGATALEALQSIPKPVKIFNKGLLTITQGELKKVMDMPVPRLRRMFYPSAQPILIKWIASGLK